MPWLMSAVIRNIEVRGSTMGSRAEFAAMTEFVRAKKVHPVLSRVVDGLEDLEAINGLFEDMKIGKQFGKLVIQILDEEKDEQKSRL